MEAKLRLFRFRHVRKRCISTIARKCERLDIDGYVEKVLGRSSD